MQEKVVERLLNADIKELFASLFGDDILVTDISYSDDIRNLTYIIGEKEFICKIYGERNRWKREISNYMLMRPAKFMTPQMIDFGMNDQKIGWMLMTYIPGVGMEELYSRLDNHSKIELWGQLGHLLADFHIKNSTFENSLYLKSDIQESNMKKISFFEKMEENYRHNQERILRRNIQEQKSIFEKAFSILDFWFYTNMKNGNMELSLCHNDFTLRNIIYNEQMNRYSLIDFESGYYAEPELDFARVLLDLKKWNMDAYFLDGYFNNAERKRDLDKIRIYLILKIIEICGWSYERARDYYEFAYRTLCNELRHVVSV